MSQVPAIEACGLSKSFGGVLAVDSLELSVPAGCIFGLLGTNGAGKTTTLRMLLGIVEPDKGSRRLLGSESPLSVARQVGYLPEERGLYPAMRAREGVAFLGALRGLPLREGRMRAEKLLADYEMPLELPIGSLSKGMAQIVQILGTIVHRPRLIVLDEPFTGLDALNQNRLEALLRKLAQDGVTILFSTHIMAHAERLCQRIAVLAGGRLRFNGSVAEALETIPPRVALATNARDGTWRSALPSDAIWLDGNWSFALPKAGIESVLRPLMEANAGIQNLSIERAGLHDVFINLVEKASTQGAPE